MPTIRMPSTSASPEGLLGRPAALEQDLGSLDDLGREAVVEVVVHLLDEVLVGQRLEIDLLAHSCDTSLSVVVSEARARDPRPPRAACPRDAVEQPRPGAGRVGPETLSAATTTPDASRTGAATAQSPGSSSSTAVAYPHARIRSSPRSPTDVAVSSREALERLGREREAAEGEEDLPERRRVRRDVPADPVRRAEEVAAVALGEQLDRARVGDSEVDRLAALAGEPVERLLGELDELRLTRLAAGVADENGAGSELARALALDQPLALERADEPGCRALRQAAPLGELADGRRLDRLEDLDEELRRAVDGLRSRCSCMSGTTVPPYESRP